MPPIPATVRQTLDTLIREQRELMGEVDLLLSRLKDLQGRQRANSEAVRALRAYYGIPMPEMAPVPRSRLLEDDEDDTRETEAARMSTYEAVKMLLHTNPDRSFTPGDMVDLVMNLNLLPPDLEDPAAAVRVALRRTVERGDGERIEHAGRGFQYRAKSRSRVLPPRVRMA